MSKRLPFVLFLVAVLVGSFLRAQDLLEPYEDRHRGACAALFSLMAKNHLRYGLAKTGGVGVINPDRCAEENFTYYAHRPQGCILLATLGAAMGGTQSGIRLIFLPFAIGIMFLVYRLARKRGPAVAAAAGGFAALMPLGVYYGAFVNFEIPTLFLALLALHLLLRYGRRGRVKDLVRGVLAFGAAVFCDWIALALLPALLITLPLLGTRRSRPGRSFLLVGLYAVAGTVAASLTLLQVSLQASRFGNPIDLSWKNYSWATAASEGFSWSTWAGRVSEYAVTLIGWPLLILACVGLVVVLTRVVRRQARDADVAALAMLLVGLCNIVAFASHAIEHDYDLLYLLPSVALLAASALPFSWAEGRKVPLVLLHAGLVAVLGASVYQSAGVMQERRSFELNSRGEEIGELTSDGDVVILVDDSFTLQVTVASDRYVDYARDLPRYKLARKRAVQLGMRGRALIVLVRRSEESTTDPELMKALEESGTRSERGPYIAFELGKL